MNKGDHVKIRRQTFLHNGVFVIQNSPVEIIDEKDGKFTVLYRDKEGLEHKIEGFGAEELGN